MKYASLAATGLLATVLALPATVLADDAHHPDQAGAPAAAQAKAPEQTVKKMQGNVKKMQGQLDRLGKARNEAEFQKLLAEHMKTMHENLVMAEGMAGMDCAMMGQQGMHGMHGMMGEGMAGQHEAMMQRMQQMEKRMDMMEQAAKPAPGR